MTEGGAGEIDGKKVKELLFSLGADWCGIADSSCFSAVSEGYHPLDVMPPANQSFSPIADVVSEQGLLIM